MFMLLLIIIYLSFIALGLPDSLFGTSWPIIHQQFNLPLSYAGIVTITISLGTIISSLLSEKLTNEFGSGFSLSGLYNMRLFYNRYKNFQPLAGNLSWSHYCYLIYIEDDYERSFYEKECINSNWSVRELKRQINTCLYERILLSKNEINKILDAIDYLKP